MNKAFEKILERLEECKERYEDIEFAEMNENGHTIDFEYARGKKDSMDEAMKIVQEVADEYNNGWIPCRERLPDNNKPVLCWVISTTIASGETYIIGSCDRGFWFLQTYEIGHHHFPVKDYKVVAWQPIPEKYKESKPE